MLKVLSKNAPVKKGHIIANEALMNKVLKKAIMKRSQVRNAFLKKKHLKVKLHIINKGTAVPASYGKKNETILK